MYKKGGFWFEGIKVPRTKSLKWKNLEGSVNLIQDLIKKNKFYSWFWLQLKRFENHKLFWNCKEIERFIKF